MSYLYDIKANRANHSYKINNIHNKYNKPEAEVKFNGSKAICGGAEISVRDELAEYVKALGNDTKKLADNFGINHTKLYTYLLKYDKNNDKKLSEYEIANGIIALDKDAKGNLDGKLDLTKLDAVKSKDKESKELNSTPHVTTDVKTVSEVSDNKEDQNGVKAKLKDSGLKDWTAVAEAREKAKTINKNGVVDNADEVAAMFGITKAAATALFKKAEQLVTDQKATSIADGLGQILQDMDLKSGGKGDGKITVGEFNDYVKKLLASDVAADVEEKKDKDAKATPRKTPPAKTPPVTEKTDPPATDNTETAEAEEETSTKPSFFSKIRLPLAIGLLLGGGLLFLNNEQKKKRFAMQQQQQHMGFAGQQQQQQIGFGGMPQQQPLPPFGPFMPQGCVPGPSNQNMFNGLMA